MFFTQSHLRSAHLAVEEALADVSLFIQQVKAVHYNDTPIVGMELYLFQGQRWSPQSFQNVTTNSEGIAEFSLCTVDLEGDIYMEVWLKTEPKTPPDLLQSLTGCP